MMTQSDLDNIKNIIKVQIILNEMDKTKYEIINMNRVLRFKGYMIIVGLVFIGVGILDMFTGDRISSLFMFATAQLWFVGSMIYKG